MTKDQTTADAALARLKGPLRWTQWGMVAERLAQAFWPVWTILLAVPAFLAFSGFAHWPLELAWGGALAVVLGFGWALLRGIRRFRWPSRDEARARLDQTLPGRPLAALADTQALGAQDAASVQVWRAHLARMADRAARARAVRPRVNLARRDPYALRYAALLAFIMTLAFGVSGRVGSLTDLAQMPGGAGGGAGPAWEGWVQPPAYTGRPALYLNDREEKTLSLPEGSRIILRLYGKPGALTVDETVSARTGEVAIVSAPAQEFDVLRSGRLAISGPGGREWRVEMIPDQAPQVTLSGPLAREADGEMRQPFSMRDDYGIVAGQAEITLDLPQVARRYGLQTAPDPLPPLVLDLPLPVMGDRAEFDAVMVENLSQHPWANLPVRLTLSAEDDRAQTGQTPPEAIILPGRRFFDPLAAALIELRRDLLWSRENAPRALQILRAVTYLPEGFIRNERIYLQLRTLVRELDTALRGGLPPEARDDAAAALWDIAVRLEEGDLTNARERLQQVQDRLSEALRRGANEAEIAELMQDMQRAMQEYIRELAETAQRNPDQQRAETGQAQEITGDQLQQMLDRIEELMKEGRTAEAAELLETLRQMLENLQVVEGGQPMPGPGQQALNDLGQTLRDQQELADEAFRSLQDRLGSQGQGQRRAEARDQARRQQALRDQLQRQGEGGLPGAGTAEGQAARDALDRAGRAMEEAEQALRENDMGQALERQAEAMAALRDGIRNLGEAVAQDEGQPRNGQAMAPGDGRDPLGRLPGASGRGIDTQDQLLQDEDIYRRARDILDELRRRSGEQDRPEPERDYLRRLLELF